MAGNRRRRDPAQVASALKQSGGRLLRALVHVLLVLGAVAGVSWGGRAGYLWLTTSPTWAIKSIAVQGNRRAGGDELARLSGLSIGRNLLLADVDSAGANVAANPWVRSVVVRRHLPDSVSIEVTEREPHLLVALDSLYLADGEGNVFKRVGRGDELNLPVVTGISRTQFQEHRAEVETQLAQLSALVDDYGHRGLTAKGGEVEELAVDDDGVSLTLGRTAVAVHLGEAPFDEKLEKLDTLFGEFERRGVHAAVVHLENRASPDRVAVKLADATPARPPVKAGTKSP